MNLSRISSQDLREMRHLMSRDKRNSLLMMGLNLGQASIRTNIQDDTCKIGKAKHRKLCLSHRRAKILDQNLAKLLYLGATSIMTIECWNFAQLAE